MPPTLAKPSPRLTRFYAGATPDTAPRPRVDREKRIIYGYAVATRGEALGHDEWLDAEFLDQIVASGNADASGVKSRFTHPGLCSDGLGRQIGRAKSFRRDGDVVRADLYFGDYTAKSPVFSKDPAEYLMDLAESDPKSFGSSIVFERDAEAMRAFAKANSGDNDALRSPDKLNTRNLPHVRLSRLCASDVVDTAAANPGGFFSETDELADVAERFFAYAFGLSSCSPNAIELAGVDPERARRFVQGFLDRRGLALSQAPKTGDAPMADTPQTPAQGDPVQAAREAFAANLKALRTAFAADLDFANQAAADGLSVESAKAKYADILTARLAEKEKALAEANAQITRLSADMKDINAKLLDGDKGAAPAPDAKKPDAYARAKEIQRAKSCKFDAAYREALKELKG